MIESFVFMLLIIGTVIGAVGGFIGASVVFFPIRALEWLLEEENDEAGEQNVLEYPQGS
jgi:hypothetical protein